MPLCVWLAYWVRGPCTGWPWTKATLQSDCSITPTFSTKTLRLFHLGWWSVPRDPAVLSGIGVAHRVAWHRGKNNRVADPRGVKAGSSSVPGGARETALPSPFLLITTVGQGPLDRPSPAQHGRCSSRIYQAPAPEEHYPAQN